MGSIRTETPQETIDRITHGCIDDSGKYPDPVQEVREGRARWVIVHDPMENIHALEDELRERRF